MSIELNDLTYGAEVLGRGVLVKADALVGMFSNNVPIRVLGRSSDPLYNLMQSVQSSLLGALSYDFVSESQIRRWAGHSGEMFDTLINVQVGGAEADDINTVRTPTVHNLDEVEGEDVHYTFTSSLFTAGSDVFARLVMSTDGVVERIVTRCFSFLLSRVLSNGEAVPTPDDRGDGMLFRQSLTRLRQHGLSLFV